MSSPIPSSALLRALRAAAHHRPIPVQHHQPRHAFIHHTSSFRPLSTTSHFTSSHPPHNPKLTTHNRGPPSSETTQTDFSVMDIYSGTTTPATSIDACTSDGFHLNNGVHTSRSEAILLLGGEAFLWHPKPTRSKTGILTFPAQSLDVFKILYPRPDLLILGTGKRLWMLDPATRKYLGELGIRVDCLDTGNASSTYNLLATERGVDGVAGALMVVGWDDNQKKDKR